MLRSALIVSCLLSYMASALQHTRGNDTSNEDTKDVADVADDSGEEMREVGSIHVLLDRAVFDYQDHVERIAAIRDTWGSNPDVQLHVLNFGKDIFESGYKDWCKGCPASQYATAPDEMDIPGEIRRSPLYAVDGHVWAMSQALADATCDWVLIGQDMLSIHVQNMRNYLSKYDPRKKLVLGNRLKGYPNLRVSFSPWGYILSRGAVQALVDSWYGDNGSRSMVEKDRNLAVHGGSTDDGFAVPLRDKLGAEFVDTRDADGRDRMFLWPPSRIQQHSPWDYWYPDRHFDPVKKDLSPETFMFFMAGASEIRELNRLYEKRASLLSGTGADNDAKASSLYTDETLRLLEPIISHSQQS